MTEPLHLTLTSDRASTDWTVDVTEPASQSLAQLLSALAAAGSQGPGFDGSGSARSRALVVDGRAVSIDTSIDRAGLVPGSVVSLDPHGASDLAGELLVLTGPDAGRRHDLALRAGTIAVGRGRGVDADLRSPTVSRRHLTLTPLRDGIEITDLSSHNGTAHGRSPLRSLVLALGSGPVEISAGAVRMELRRPVPYTPTCGMVRFARPPRVNEPRPSTAIAAPAEPGPAPTPARFSWATATVPLVLGLAMALVLDPRFALFALASPVIAGGTWWEDRRRCRRERRRTAAERSSENRRVSREVVERADDLRAWLDRRTPPPGVWTERVRRGSSRLWERRPGHDDHLLVRIGQANIPWTPTFETVHGARAERPRGSTAIADAPLAVAFGPGRWLGLAGAEHDVHACARAIVVQIVCAHGPADVSVDLRWTTPANRDRHWDWCKWLPHLADPEGGFVAIEPDPAHQQPAGPEEVGVLGSLETRVAGPTTIEIMEAAAGAEAGAPGVGRDRGTGIVIAAHQRDLPAWCSTVVDITGPGFARATDVRSGQTIDPVLVDGVALDVAIEVARTLARHLDPEARPPGGVLPAAVSLMTLLGDSTLNGVGRGGRGPGGDDGCGDDDSACTDPRNSGNDGDDEARVIVERWAANPGGRPAAVIGVTPDGPFVLDLAVDGPHALVAGTTGAGKSELLRTLVVSLALHADPEHLAFVLVDFKGGSAFDACAALPHTVGVVTDLDERLAARALRCLEAELRRRERVLRDAGSSDIAAYHRASSTDGPDARSPLPRLVVVIDEFATLASELPEFVNALVDVAQRGRSLGVHLVLATQRPSGVVSASIRANTNIRIALRVQDSADSADVIDRPDAARLPRRAPGRGLVRLGPGEIIPFQTALSSGVSASSRQAAITVAPFGIGDRLDVVAASPEDATRPSEPGAAPDPEPASDLETLVAHTVRASARAGMRTSAAPWPDPLPAAVSLRDLAPAPGEGLDGTQDSVEALDRLDEPVTVGIVDDPDAQCLRPLFWAPEVGHLLVVGAPGSGTTTTLRTLAEAVAVTRSPDRLHMYAIDFGGGGLAATGAYPVTGAVVAAGETERLERLIRRIRNHLEDRRAAAAGGPRLLLLIDNLPGVLAALVDDRRLDLHDSLVRIVADGSALGVTVVATAESPHAVSLSVSAAFALTWCLRLADRTDALAMGIDPAGMGALPPGRGFSIATGLEIQIARPSDTPPLMALRRAGRAGRAGRVGRGSPSDGPDPIGLLPDLIDTATIIGGSHTATGVPEGWLPVGVSSATLTTVGFTIRDGDHLLVAGPPRSGRSGVLAHLASAALGIWPDVELTVVCPRSSPLRGQFPEHERRADTLEALAVEVIKDAETADGTERTGDHLHPPRRPLVIVIDDADAVDDPTGALSRLVRSRARAVTVIAAGATELLLSDYGHWTKEVRRSRLGIVLRPTLERDGELWQVGLPRRAPGPFPPGRGYLVGPDGVELVQCAAPLAAIARLAATAAKGAAGAGVIATGPAAAAREQTHPSHPASTPESSPAPQERASA